MSTYVKDRRQSRVRLVLLAAIMLLLLVASPAPPAASSRTGCFFYEKNRFYTDATFTTQCGYIVYWCDGSVGRSGCQYTGYTKTEYCECIEY